MAIKTVELKRYPAFKQCKPVERIAFTRSQKDLLAESTREKIEQNKTRRSKGSEQAKNFHVGVAGNYYQKNDEKEGKKLALARKK